MSKHNRTSRRRRIALGLGATGGGLLAAAFMPVGIALADTTTTAITTLGDPGLFPIDQETVPDAFSDFTGVPDLGANGVADAPTAEGLLDQQLNLDNSALAAQIDYDIDNNEPFSFNTLDGIGATPADYNGEANGDFDPFEDAFLNNNGQSELGTLSTGETWADAQSYDYALNQVLDQGQLTQLDGLADGTITSVAPGIPVPDNDPVADFVQIFDPHAFANPVSPDAPTDFVGQLASFDDQFLNAFGLAGPLDSFVDTFTGGMTNTTVDALGGLGSTTADTLTGLGGTGTDMFTGLLGGIDPLSFFGF